MKNDTLQAITIPFAEGSSLRIGEEATTEAVGEENPTGTAGEGPSPSISSEGGPFGSY